MSDNRKLIAEARKGYEAYGWDNDASISQPYILAANLADALEAAEQRIKELEEAIKRAKPLLRHDSTSAKCFEAIQVLASVVK